MRTKNFLTMAALAGAMALTACTNTDEVTTENPNFPADRVIRVTTHIEAPVTRAGMTTNNVKNFNIKINNTANSTYSYQGFYYKESDGWTCYTDGNMETPLTMLWQNSKQEVTVIAVSKDEAEFTNLADNIQMEVNANQSEEYSLKESDILYMAPTTINPTNDLVDGKLPITFKHIMSKVDISITLGTEMNTTPGTVANPISELTVNGTKRSFNWNASNNSPFDLASFSAEAVTPYAGIYTPGSGNETRAVANYEVILVPQTVAAGEFSVTFKIGEKDYSWTSTGAITLERGKLHTLALSAGKDVVTMGKFTTTPWTGTDGGSLGTE